MSRLRSAFRLLYWEGAFSMIYDTWVGPTYLSGLGGELHVPVLYVSLICSAAWIGAVGQLVGSWAYERVPSYKRYTVAAAAVSRGMWLLPLLFAAYWMHQSRMQGRSFPAESWFALTAAVACLGALFGASSAASWNSWMRALVPQRLRGRFFGGRQRFVMVALIGANLLASACIDWRPGGLHAGFAVLGALAVTAAGVSTWLLSRVRDAGTPHVVESSQSFTQKVLEPLRDRRFRGIVLYGAAFNGALQLASSYFPYYFTREMHFPMSQVAFWTVLNNIGCLLAAAAWGKFLDRSGATASVMRAMGSFVALSPLLYVTPSILWVRMIAPADYLTNGMIWCGYQLALTTLLFKSIPSRSSTALCFSIYTAAAGLCGAVGSLLGGRLAVWLMPWGGFRALFLVASACRFAVIWGMYSLVQEKSQASGEDELVAEYA
jgi:MFS family permease